ELIVDLAHLVGGELGVLDDVGEQIEAQRQVLRARLAGDERAVVVGGGLQLAADEVDRLRDLIRRALVGALAQHRRGELRQAAAIERIGRVAHAQRQRQVDDRHLAARHHDHLQAVRQREALDRAEVDFRRRRHRRRDEQVGAIGPRIALGERGLGPRRRDHRNRRLVGDRLGLGVGLHVGLRGRGRRDAAGGSGLLLTRARAREEHGEEGALHLEPPFGSSITRLWFALVRYFFATRSTSPTVIASYFAAAVKACVGSCATAPSTPIWVAISETRSRRYTARAASWFLALASSSALTSFDVTRSISSVIPACTLLGSPPGRYAAKVMN